MANKQNDSGKTVVAKYLSSLSGIIGRYKYALIVALIGILLIIIPFGGNSTEKINTDAKGVNDVLGDTEKKLEAILGECYGIGRVRVILSLEKNNETVYAENTKTVKSGNDNVSFEEEKEISVIAAGSGNEQTVIKEIYPPVYKGAIVVCEGADSAAIRLWITEALSSFLGIGSDKIAVYKMS